MDVQVWRGDITTLDVDALVNAANERLAPGGGVCGAIHRAAGPELAQACARLGGCPTGRAVATPGFGLRARHVLHTVGPVWRGGREGEPGLLASCYRESLALAATLGARSLAFPALSTGIFGYPLEAACRIAVGEVRGWSQDLPERVLLVGFDTRTAEALDAALRTGESRAE